MIKNKYVKGFVMILPAVAVIVATIFAVQVKAPSLALDQEALDVLNESVIYASDTPGTASPGGKNKPKINHGAASAAKGLATGKATAAPSAAGASKSVSHNKALDNATYKDGTYTGTATGFNGPVTVRVTIKGGKIAKVEIVSHTDTPEYFSRAKAVTGRIVSKQSPNVDAVSGATYSSNGIIKATEKALAKAVTKTAAKAKKNTSSDKKEKKKSTTPARKPSSEGTVTPEQPVEDYESADGYKDGTYTGAANGYHGLVTVQVTITDGKIAAVNVLSHSDTDSYFFKAKKLIKKIIKNQTPDVDTISGATLSSNGIINAVKKALQAAAKKPVVVTEPTDEVSGTKYENGIYEGSAVGYTNGAGLVCMTYVTVKVTDNKIAHIDVESQDPILGGDEWYWDQAYPAIPDNIVKTNNPDVDTISGATMSSNGIINAVKDALKGHELTSEPKASALRSAPAEAPKEAPAEEQKTPDPAAVPEETTEHAEPAEEAEAPKDENKDPEPAVTEEKTTAPAKEPAALDSEEVKEEQENED